ncbi:bifunctional nicotinamidase/pyrazinamidase [Gimesia sp.]|uniref:bifunctional nicotinamidase/pyrazinamidase n=1 Tax=Gimesia sp. TaxID=2024833 RepID=UPI000C67B86E|nr:bifunctional nicotinamidase/pyrazinamidase [Gimesia sp.]MAX36326.1 nicotinamidase/pyrazinamidase [Gimesia sp.]HAH49064.1 bifunctional nicotinamidase/pyrazinamidase [Planctomycetaceae bacterium]HBL45121.1 bifunctional nicotinamidase/pyrazinamidase [Planctomycetaceae bacterium]|tara:strand:+ start:1160 stop:1759 length:600 start_codon:yes stop_codon:yes gene_type:complete
MHALILVDLQYDFMPGGSLAVPEGDQVVSIANQLMADFDLVVATQDWHPPDHLSFASQHPDREIGEQIELGGLEQILWPDHCVQGTRGAEFHADLNQTSIDKVFPKGTDRLIDSYSGFYDNGHQKSTGLGEYLQEQQVKSVTVLGLATDFCVKWTALDAVKLGFQTRLIQTGCRGVDLSPGDVGRACQEMQQAGVKIIE